jgi:hypothetical protein
MIYYFIIDKNLSYDMFLPVINVTTFLKFLNIAGLFLIPVNPTIPEGSKYCL